MFQLQEVCRRNQVWTVCKVLPLNGSLFPEDLPHTQFDAEDDRIYIFLLRYFFSSFFLLLTECRKMKCWKVVSICSRLLSVLILGSRHILCFSFSPSFRGAIALILCYTAYLLRPCVYIRRSARRLLTLEAAPSSKNYSFSGQFCRTDRCLV